MNCCSVTAAYLMLGCSHGHTASWLTSRVQIIVSLFVGIFLRLLHDCAPCSFPLYQPIGTAEFYLLHTANHTNKHTKHIFPLPLIFSCHATIHLLNWQYPYLNQPPKRSSCYMPRLWLPTQLRGWRTTTQ